MHDLECVRSQRSRDLGPATLLERTQYHLE